MENDNLSEGDSFKSDADMKTGNKDDTALVNGKSALLETDPAEDLRMMKMSFAPKPEKLAETAEANPFQRSNCVKEIPDISDDEEAYIIDFTKFNRQQKLTWNHMGGAFQDHSFRSNHYNPFAPQPNTSFQSQNPNETLPLRRQNCAA